jgi:hypothetical protein
MPGSIIDRVSGPAVRVGELVDGYARRVHPAVLEQHDGGSVSSPLGVWLLLAACATGAQEVDREALELARCLDGHHRMVIASRVRGR